MTDTQGDGNGNTLSPEPPAPRCSWHLRQAVTVTVSDIQAHMVLNLGVLSSTPFNWLDLSARSQRFSPNCRAAYASCAEQKDDSNCNDERVAEERGAWVKLP